MRCSTYRGIFMTLKCITGKGTQRRFENLSISLSSHENNMSKISHHNTFHFLRYARAIYVKCMFTNIKKQ